jgi:hypothetical protein
METIEEFAEKILADNIDGLKDILEDDLFYFYRGVIIEYGKEIAILAKEKMYSEEDLLNFLIKREENLQNTENIFDYRSAKEWFEQFKKQ